MNTIRWFSLAVAATALVACTAETQAPTDETREAEEASEQTTERTEAETPAVEMDGLQTAGSNPLYKGN